MNNFYLGFTKEEYGEVYKKMVEITNQSESQIDVFFNHLERRFKENGIASIQDLKIQYEKLDLDERKGYLREIIGVYLVALLDLLLSLVSLNQKDKLIWRKII
ncbi:hypothetical protein QU593_10555 [Rossellomorea marisflavi]|uniref:hypothetical protein n=1 Tax=Rossellomorea marisflavi TaxID=189381 RepID=UPI0025B226C8|nr:hypothetical protein [Rossellomorea marisflavi]WJV20847.1 hypothetical protein QU593_10555 [Rossellomorea marisflavi]